jgi:hypothetical protein
MSNSVYSEILDTKDKGFLPGEYDFMLLSEYKQAVEDADYFDFIINSTNGGFFYKQSLHVYGYSAKYDFHDISNINSLLRQEIWRNHSGVDCIRAGSPREPILLRCEDERNNLL